MSALGGFCFWNGMPVSKERLSVLSRGLQAAGPDSRGTVQPQPWLALQSHILSFDRLSEHERQPYALARGSVLTWSGRLDNRDDLLLSLHRFLREDESDVAVVAAAYERWGDDAIPRLIGDWCLAIWDAERQRMVFARDHMGNRPLYYHAGPDRLAWATRLEALADSERLIGAPDDIFIALYVTGDPPRRRTSFAGILALEAGHLLIATRDGVTVRRYWKYSPAKLRYRSLEQYGDHLRMLLTEAVRVRLRANRTIWAHLSGGWDSSSVVCLAHRLIAQGGVEAPALRTVSLVPEDREAASERRFMAAVEQWCGIETTTVPYRGRPTVMDMAGHRILLPTQEGVGTEEPARLAGDRIVLTGCIGDVFGNAEPLLPMWEPLYEGHPLKCARGFVSYAQTRKRPVASIFFEALRRGFGSTAQRRPNRQGIQPQLLAQLTETDHTAQSLIAEFPRTHRPLVEMLYRFADLRIFEVQENSAPVLWTHPYSHRPLLEYLLAVPRLAIFHPLFARSGMRCALREVLPEAILERNTQVGITSAAFTRARRREAERMKRAEPFTRPVPDWLIVQRNVVEPTVLAKDLREMQAGARPTDFLYRCAQVEIWLHSLQVTSGDYGRHVPRVPSEPEPSRMTSFAALSRNPSSLHAPSAPHLSPSCASPANLLDGHQ